MTNINRPAFTLGATDVTVSPQTTMVPPHVDCQFYTGDLHPVRMVMEITNMVLGSDTLERDILRSYGHNEVTGSIFTFIMSNRALCTTDSSMALVDRLMNITNIVMEINNPAAIHTTLLMVRKVKEEPIEDKLFRALVRILPVGYVTLVSWNDSVDSEELDSIVSDYVKLASTLTVEEHAVVIMKRISHEDLKLLLI